MTTATQQAKTRAEKDREILLKYQTGRPMEKSDEAILRMYELIGLVHFGFSFRKKETQVSLTESCKKLMGLESAQLNPTT